MPFEVPEGWCWCHIDDLCYTIFAGGDKPSTFSATQTSKYNIPIYANAIQKEGLYGYTDKAAVEMPAITVSARGTIGFVCVRKTPFVPIVRLITLVPICCIKIEYIAHALQYFVSPAEGSSIPQLTVPTFKSTLIPIPPLEEQKRIVDQIENIHSFIDAIDVNKHGLDNEIKLAKSKILDLAIHGKLVPQDVNDEPASELLKRINQKAVASCDNPQYGKVPSSWIISTVGEVFAINPKTHVEDDTEAAFVPMTCVADGYSNTFEYECRKWGDIKKGFVHFQENDVAVAKISPCLENRKSVVFHDLPNGIGAGTTELNVFRCEEILPEYALFYFKSQMFIGSCAGTYNGVVGQQRVAKSFIQELPIGIPPYNEQLRIVSKVNELFSQLDRIEKNLQA